jgi:hypothetical protein
MPNMADITVKKADGTTNVVYVAATPSAGDKSPAVWTQNAFSGTLSHCPRFEFQTQDNGAGSIRQARSKFSYPIFYTDTTTSQEVLLKSLGFDGIFYMPKELTTTQWNEAWAQLGNLLCSTLVRSAVQAGYSPT